MEYRILPHGGEKISVIGLGAGSLTGTEQEMRVQEEMTRRNSIKKHLNCQSKTGNSKYSVKYALT